MTKRIVALVGLVSLLLAAAPPPELGRRGLVSADHRLASEAGAEILSRGGNAVDAVVAAALACGVVQPAGSGLGGGGFAVVLPEEGDATVLDFREVAPAAATRDMFADSQSSRIGGRAVAVPGEAVGLAELHARFGVLSLRDVVRPAVRLARGGFPVGAHLAGALKNLGPDAEAFSMTLFRRTVPIQGESLVRARIARTLEVFARTKGRDFTHGATARDIVAAVTAAGGVMTTADLEAYAPTTRDPLVGNYRGWRIHTMPPPSSGGAVLLQVLGVLEGFELEPLGHNSADLLHLYAEAFQHAFADRANYMGDPERVQVPLDAMLAAERIAEIQRQIVPGRTFSREYYGTPIDPGEDGGTQHISVIDQAGMAVALTTTINTSFGSRVVAARSGILLNNEMDDFVARPGEPNAYGLIGSEANAVAPGARPLSSMSPTVLVSPEGERIAIGASGGPFIITSTLQAIVNIVDFGMDPAAAVSVPRIHHQWAPEKIFLDTGISPDTERALVARGHTTTRMPFFSSVQVAQTFAADGVYGASDPRKGGWPAGNSR